MPQIIMGPSQTGALDASVKKQAYAFLEKLATDDSSPGLHIEPMHDSADSRVRTGRVNDFYRAVLFKVQGQGASAHYVYLGVLAHDDAIAFARKARLSVNPVNGIAELLVAEEPPAVPVAATAPSPADEPAPSLLRGLGFDEQALVDELGLDAELARVALDVATEDELLTLVDSAVEWQALALLDLASGSSLSSVRATLGLDEPAVAAAESEDEELLTALQHPAARLQFAFIEDDEELRRAIEEDDFAAWRVFLHPEQRKYATSSYNGPFRLSGGAGTGKTVVLLHRARHLARRNPAERILLTTYTRNLADALRADLRRLDPEVPIAAALGDPGVFVSGIDASVSAVLRRHREGLDADLAAVLGPRSSEISGRTPDALWQECAGAAGADLPDELRSRAFLSAEYAMVVLPSRAVVRDDYLTARRPGRGVALDRKKRIGLWQAVEAYRTRSSIGGTIDFAEAAAVAASALQRNGPLVDHALVDEGQDLGPSHWQFLRALAAEGKDDLFLAEDSHQRIYGQQVVLGRYGIRIVGRSQRLKLNYRTTAQNLRYALRMLDVAGGWTDLEDQPEAALQYRSARSGPSPQVHRCASLTEELDLAAKTVNEWLAEVDPATIGILVRDAQQAGQVTRGLDDRGVTVRSSEQGQHKQDAPVVMTMHRAKGTEFCRVLIFGVDEGLVPADYLLKELPEAERTDAIKRERSLLYVAATRARDELVVTTGGKPSPFLHALAGA